MTQYDEVLCRVLHRFRIASVNHTFNIFCKELQSPRQSGLVGPTAEVEVGEFRVSLREIFFKELAMLRYAEGLCYQKDVPLLDDLKMQFTRGLRFFAACDKDVVVALNSVHTQEADLVYPNKPHLRLPKGVIYFNAALTAPHYRNLGIGTALFKYVGGVMQREGYSRAMSATFLENRGAARWHLANGFLRWGKVRYLRVGGKDFWWTQLTEVGRRYPDLVRGAA